MKKLSILAALFVSFLAFTSCESDRDDNPKVQLPSQQGATFFEMNNPVIGSQAIDLKQSESIELKAHAAPNYGFPAEIIYGAQVSLSQDFAADKTQTLTTTGSSTVYQAMTAEIDKALMLLRQCYVEEDFNTLFSADERTNGMDIFVRLTAIMAYSADSSSFVVSNAKSLKVIPYFVEALNTPPHCWYLVGGIIADGTWGNSKSGIGVSLIPFYTKKGETYSKATGDGVFEYTGYFAAGEFKIVENAGDWDHGMCGGTEAGGQVYRNGGDDPGNIKVENAGYYTLTLDTKAHTLQIAPYTEVVATYSSITMPGDINSWDQANGNPFTPITTVAENHDWVADVTFDDDFTDGVKFAADGSWTVNWGAAEFPWGVGVGNGPNIPYKKGAYKVFFNDITGQYMFVEKTEE